jgi:hypothetical protein
VAERVDEPDIRNAHGEVSRRAAKEEQAHCYCAHCDRCLDWNSEHFEPCGRQAAVGSAERPTDAVYRRIDRKDFTLLTALRSGSTLAEALGKASYRSPLKPEEQVAKIQGYFAHASELGWIFHPDARVYAKNI